MSSKTANAMALQHRPRKRFGQNFLRDTNVIERIVDAIHPTGDDHIIEIGPGQGALTKYLLPACRKLEVIELDRDLAAHLAEGLQKEEHFQIHQQDVLKFDFDTLDAEEKSLRIVGNLPYNISTPVMFYLLKYQHLIKDMTFMLQLEVVNRLAAKTGDKNYGRLGLMVQYHCQVEHLFNVPSAAFTPKPKVSSAIVRLAPHPTLPAPARDVNCLKLVIRTAFNQRRKILKNSLKSLVSEEVLNTLPLDTSLRPENLSLQDYVLISDAISNSDRND
ncbi:MAG TPA: 16S rRNA (adenine(1518)-N(6)/adenine(1519)-N(6))-dimethyltransferase RsmA [Gammaproteobacteria bacterium]|jgi:16S rRNA (adenine1518-N6/adenine1519-N6)-dimethyltransferase|nr:16S rRNA (adenine(1518)-N(6)/adenine(1519)-N(6))-dimethyltransferase RsmA [Gammaproteobacteria bacterium]